MTTSDDLRTLACEARDLPDELSCALQVIESIDWADAKDDDPVVLSVGTLRKVIGPAVEEAERLLQDQREKLVPPPEAHLRAAVPKSRGVTTDHRITIGGQDRS